jgi:hypothetical protein
MNPASFSQIQSSDNKQPLQAVSGVISAMYPRETKQGNFGPYQIQKLTIQEPSTGATLRATIFDADEFHPHHIGHQFSATWGKNAKGQFLGLAADHYNPANGSPTVYGVKCSKGGMLYLDGQPFSMGPVPPTPAAPPLVAYQPPPPAPAPFFQPPQTAPIYVPPPVPQQVHAPLPFAPPSPVQGQIAPAVDAPKSPLAFLAGQSAAYAMCFEAALKVREQMQLQLEQGPGEPLGTEDVRNIATAFYIEGNRKGIFSSVVGNLSESEP